MSIWNSVFWKDVAERTIGTAAQVLLAILSVDGLDLVNVDLAATATAVGIAAALVVLKSVVAQTLVSNQVSPASLAKKE